MLLGADRVYSQGVTMPDWCRDMEAAELVVSTQQVGTSFRVIVNKEKWRTIGNDKKSAIGPLAQCLDRGRDLKIAILGSDGSDQGIVNRGYYVRPLVH
jgi:hypothetical protein